MPVACQSRMFDAALRIQVVRLYPDGMVGRSIFLSSSIRSQCLPRDLLLPDRLVRVRSRICQTTKRILTVVPTTSHFTPPYPVELLAPAGCFPSLQAAISAGADAVYFGLAQLKMRARAGRSFELTDLEEIMLRCKSGGIKGFLPLNTIL